jgi:hypothetical protein
MQWLIPSGLHCASIGSAVSLLQPPTNAAAMPAKKRVDQRPRIATTLHRVRTAATGFREYCGYIQTVRSCLVILVAFGCGGTSPEVKQVAHTGQGSGATTTTATHAGSGAGSAAVAIAPDVGCLTATCAYHQGTATYFTCLAGGAGVCFHFGAACTPAESCMIDAADRTYKKCTSPVEGTCTQWGTACAPANACMFSFDDGLYHHCDEVAGGSCKRYGALCAP